MRRRSWLALPLTAVLILAGCSADPKPATEPSDPSPTVSPDATTPEEPVGPTVPECAGIAREEGAEVSGTDFAACIVAFSVAAGSGRQRVTSDALTGTVDFVYGTSPQAHVVSEAPPAEIIVTDAGAWVRGDAGWDSGELAQLIGEAWRVFAQPAVAFGMLAGTDYTITAQERIKTPEGTETSAWRFTANGPIAAGGVAVESLEMWLSDELVPLRQESVSSFQGRFRGTTVNEYYDWGADIDLPSVD